MTLCLDTIHLLPTDDEQQTDDNCNIDTYSIAVAYQK